MFFFTLQIKKTPVVGVRENIICFKNVKKYMFINPQTKDFVPKSSGTGKIECKQMCIRRRLQNLWYRINLNDMCSFKIHLQTSRQIAYKKRLHFQKFMPRLQNLRYQQMCTQDRSSFPKIYPILRLQKPPVVPSNLHASIQPLCNVIPFWRFRASS